MSATLAWTRESNAYRGYRTLPVSEIMFDTGAVPISIWYLSTIHLKFPITLILPQDYKSSFGDDHYVCLDAMTTLFKSAVEFRGATIGLTPLFLMAYRIEELLKDQPAREVQLNSLAPLFALKYGSTLMHTAFGCSSLEQLLVEQLSLFFVIENRENSPVVKLRLWNNVHMKQHCAAESLATGVTSSAPSTSERDAEEHSIDHGEVLADSRVKTPDIIGDVHRRSVKINLQSPSADMKREGEEEDEIATRRCFKPFRIEPVRGSGSSPVKQEGGSRQYGQAFPHSPHAPSIRFADGDVSTAGSRDQNNSGHNSREQKSMQSTAEMKSSTYAGPDISNPDTVHGSKSGAQQQFETEFAHGMEGSSLSASFYLEGIPVFRQALDLDPACDSIPVASHLLGKIGYGYYVKQMYLEESAGPIVPSLPPAVIVHMASSILKDLVVVGIKEYLADNGVTEVAASKDSLLFQKSKALDRYAESLKQMEKIDSHRVVVRDGCPLLQAGLAIKKKPPKNNHPKKTKKTIQKPTKNFFLGGVLKIFFYENNKTFLFETDFL
jgi:hypothetical protein